MANAPTPKFPSVQPDGRPTKYALALYALLQGIELSHANTMRFVKSVDPQKAIEQLRNRFHWPIADRWIKPTKESGWWSEYKGYSLDADFIAELDHKQVKDWLSEVAHAIERFQARIA